MNLFNLEVSSRWRAQASWSFRSQSTLASWALRIAAWVVFRKAWWCLASSLLIQWAGSSDQERHRDWPSPWPWHHANNGELEGPELSEHLLVPLEFIVKFSVLLFACYGDLHPLSAEIRSILREDAATVAPKFNQIPWNSVYIPFIVPQCILQSLSLNGCACAEIWRNVTGDQGVTEYQGKTVHY